MDKRVALIGGMGLGAGLMFLLDPGLGRRRRQVIGDKARSLASDCGDHVGKTGRNLRNLRNHAKGWVAEGRHLLRDEPVDDVTLVERVRAALGRATSHSGAIEVAARDGSVTLSGPVPASELDGVIAQVASVRGVRDLDCRLEGQETPGDERLPDAGIVS
jgi:osmotically-inducible protein OsmY